MYLFFDTETSDLPRNYKAPVSDTANWPRLVQLAYLLHDEKGQELARGNFLIRPEGFRIAPKAMKVHGISTERALAEGVELSPVLEEFLAQLKAASHVVAHNLAFDEKIIGTEYYRAGKKNVFRGKTKLCTMQAGTGFCRLPGPYGFKWPKLNELHHKLFGTRFDGAHDALADIEATARCFWGLRTKGYI